MTLPVIAPENSKSPLSAKQEQARRIENLRILCLNYEYPPVGGGGGRVAARLNAELVRRGHAVRVQTAGLAHLPRRETIDGVEIFRTESFRKKEDTCTVPEMGLYVLTSLLPTLHHIHTWKPDVIHAHFAVPTGALAFAARLLTRVPYVLTAHLGDVPGGVPEQTAGLFRLVKPLTNPIWKSAAAVTAVSSFVANLAEKAYRRRPKVIPNGIKLGPRPEIHVNTPPRIVMAGRLSIQKNPILAIHALSQLRNLDWTLEVIGDGPLRVQMEETARAAGISGRITFHGWLEASNVASILAKSDILLMTSLSEGLPVIAIEALDRGMAIVSSRIGGVADVIQEGHNGLLANLDPGDFAAKLGAVIRNPIKLSAMRAASSEIAQQFDLDAIVSRYETVLAGACR